MTEDKIYKEDKYTAIVLDTGVNINDAINVTIAVDILGEEEQRVWVGSVYENTKIIYMTTVDDLIPGTYKLQAVVETLLGKWRGDTATFKVYDWFT